MQQLSCAVVDFLANLKLPSFILTPLIIFYAKLYGANLEEAARGASEFRTFNEFFTRELKPGSRVIEGEIIAPVDGTLVDVSPVEKSTVVKGTNIDIARLLSNKEMFSLFNNGAYLNFYLAPGDYHRIHAPISGKVLSILKIPGTLYTVKPNPAKDSVLPINKRVVVLLDTSIGPVAVVLIGALNVGRIEFAPSIFEGATLNVGDQIGAFFLGSSVVVVFPSSISFQLSNHCRTFLMGEKLL